MQVALPVRHGDGQQAVRWDPFAELTRLDQQLHEYLGNWARLPSLFGEATSLLADLEETDDAYIVEVEVPGAKREDIDVEVAGRRLRVSGERKERERTGILRRSTRTVGRFEHEVVLPGEVDEEGIEASLDEGVLTVRIPKSERERPKRISVK